MTIERTRELLGDSISHLSDQEVFEMIGEARQLADVFIDLSIQKDTYKNKANELK